MASPAKRSSYWRAGGGAFLIAATLCGGCSLIFHVDASQCSTTADCAARGAAFAGYTCNSQGTCVAPQCVRDQDCAARDAALTGYTCSQFTCMPPMMTMNDGGMDGPNEAEAGCKTNADCPITNPQRREVACDVDTHTCRQLTSDQCPVVIGDFSGSAAPPAFLGAFAVFPTTGGALTHPTYLNYKLALDEFKTNLGGIPVGIDGNSRVPCAVACDVSQDVDLAMQHLINDVGVSTVVSALPTVQLSHVFQTYESSTWTNNNLFIVNALAADSTLVGLTTNGLLWHMLGQPGDAAPAYAAFLHSAEQYIRNNAPWNIGPTAPIKVVTITGNATATNALAGTVKPLLTWNGGADSAQTGDANYLDIFLNESTLNGTDPSDPTLMSDAYAAEQMIYAFHPNIVISFASDEFVKVIEDLEIDWSTPPPEPFYMIGPYNMGSTILQVDLKSTWQPNLYKHIGGVGVASADPAYQSVLAGYESRFLMAYSGRQDALGEENYYDAMYFAVYSRLAAGRIFPVGGADLSGGMRKLISLTSTAYDVGPSDMGHISLALANRSPIELIGALGAPDFDLLTGSRVGAGDIYCIGPQADAGGAYTYQYDVLRLVNADGSAPDGGSAFQGSFPCYSGLQ